MPFSTLSLGTGSACSGEDYLGLALLGCCLPADTE